MEGVSYTVGVLGSFQDFPESRPLDEDARGIVTVVVVSDMRLKAILRTSGLRLVELEMS